MTTRFSISSLSWLGLAQRFFSSFLLCASPLTDYVGRGACLKSMTQTVSGRRLMKIVAVAYVVQAAAAVVIGFTLPILRYFGVW